MSNYQINDKQLAMIFKALGHPHRLALFRRLATCCAPGTVCDVEEAMYCCVGDLGAGLNIAPSTLSHHLKELSQAGVVLTRRNGKMVECWVEPEILKQLALFFSEKIVENR